MEKTLIQVSNQIWSELNRRKRMGETFDDVIKRMLLEFPEEKQ